MKKVAVLGLGRMGHGIASRLLQCGYAVVIWNRTYSKAADLISKGAIWADTPLLASSDVNFVFSMQADDQASTVAWMGESGSFNSLQPGAFVIECSTLSSNHVAHISTIARKKGFFYIDCPVTGLPEAATNGELTLLVGADPSELETARPVLEAISGNIRYFGTIGAGTAYKLIINLMGAVQIAALAEGIALAKRLDMDMEAVIGAIENSAAASPQVVRHARNMAELNFSKEPAFTASLRLKDAIYGLELAESVKSPAPLGTAAASWFEKASKDDPFQDEAAVINNI